MNFYFWDVLQYFCVSTVNQVEIITAILKLQSEVTTNRDQRIQPGAKSIIIIGRTKLKLNTCEVIAFDRYFVQLKGQIVALADRIKTHSQITSLSSIDQYRLIYKPMGLIIKVSTCSTMSLY